VCFFWGTTYLAIRMALESFPPLLLVASRFLISGSIMLVFAMVRGLHIPRGRELRIACVSGVLILWVGNGMLVFAEMLMASGMAGHFVTIWPFCMVGIVAALPGG
jgi:drug/metabolite transporter (DMT)-like permease